MLPSRYFLDLTQPEIAGQLLVQAFTAVWAAGCASGIDGFAFLTGQTPGKMLFGLRVEGEDGEALHLSQAFLRSVGGLLALSCLGIGFVPVLGKGRRLGWNDLLAGTRLVSAKEETAAGD